MPAHVADSLIDLAAMIGGRIMPAVTVVPLCLVPLSISVPIQNKKIKMACTSLSKILDFSE